MMTRALQSARLLVYFAPNQEERPWSATCTGLQKLVWCCASWRFLALAHSALLTRPTNKVIFTSKTGWNFESLTLLRCWLWTLILELSSAQSANIDWSELRCSRDFHINFMHIQKAQNQPLHSASFIIVGWEICCIFLQKPKHRKFCWQLCVRI